MTQAAPEIETDVDKFVQTIRAQLPNVAIVGFNSIIGSYEEISASYGKDPEKASNIQGLFAGCQNRMTALLKDAGFTPKRAQKISEQIHALYTQKNTADLRTEREDVIYLKEIRTALPETDRDAFDALIERLRAYAEAPIKARIGMFAEKNGDELAQLLADAGLNDAKEVALKIENMYRGLAGISPRASAKRKMG